MPTLFTKCGIWFQEMFSKIKMVIFLSSMPKSLDAISNSNCVEIMVDKYRTCVLELRHKLNMC